MTIAYGVLGPYEYHLSREGFREGGAALEFARGDKSIWLWFFGLELIISRRPHKNMPASP